MVWLAIDRIVELKQHFADWLRRLFEKSICNKTFCLHLSCSVKDGVCSRAAFNQVNDIFFSLREKLNPLIYYYFKSSLYVHSKYLLVPYLKFCII